MSPSTMPLGTLRASVLAYTVASLMLLAISALTEEPKRPSFSRTQREINPRMGQRSLRRNRVPALPPPNIKTAVVKKPSCGGLMLGRGARKGVEARQKAHV